MNRSCELILNAIKKERLTGKEIAEKTGLSYDGIRGRISELQAQGYPIKKDDNKYYIEQMEKITPFIIKKDGTDIVLTIPVGSVVGVPLKQVQKFEELSKEFLRNLKVLIKEVRKEDFWPVTVMV